MNKIKIIGLLTLLCFVCTVPAFAAVNWDNEPKNYDVRVFIDSKDNEVTFPADMGKPFIAKDRTFVPYRILAEKLGAAVDWDNAQRKVTAKGNNNTVELFIGNQSYKVNGAAKVMDVEPFILSAESRTYIPARYLVEGLDYQIDFAQDGKAMYIVSFTKGQAEAERKAVLDEVKNLNTQKPDPGDAKQVTIDCHKVKEKYETINYPEFEISVAPTAVYIESNDNKKYRFICTNYPEMNTCLSWEFGNPKPVGERRLDNVYQRDLSINNGAGFGIELKRGITLEYDIYDEAGAKIYEMTFNM